MPSPVALEISAKFSPYVQKEEDKAGTGLKPTVKAYKNEEFLLGHDGRLVRMMCEFEEPQRRLRRNYIRSTVLFFGSARSMTRAQYDHTLGQFEDSLSEAATEEEREKIQSNIERLKKTEWMCEWMDATERLARLVAEFAQNDPELINRSFKYMPDYFKMGFNEHVTSMEDVRRRCNDLVVTTGGGPGFMEAANRGAASVPDVKTMGMGISLPFEKGLNAYVSDDLAFEFHYFFTRKYWMMYSCRAIVVAPGGFGTLDEMFELLTLRQTKKIPNLPVVLFGTKFWKTVINWQAMADLGVVSQAEVDSLYFTDSPEEALEFIKAFYVALTCEE